MHCAGTRGKATTGKEKRWLRVRGSPSNSIWRDHPLTPMRGKWTQKLILNEENKKMEKFGEGDASLVQVSALGWA